MRRSLIIGIEIISQFLFWTISTYMILFADKPEWGIFDGKKDPIFYPFLIGIIFNMFLFYSNAYYLIPRFLNKNKKSIYLFSILLLFIGSTALETASDFSFANKANYVYEANSKIYQIVLNSLMHVLFLFLSFVTRILRDKKGYKQKQDLLMVDKSEIRFNQQPLMIGIQVSLQILFWIFSIIPPLDTDPDSFGILDSSTGSIIYPYMIGVFLNMLLFYLNAYYLIPQFLNKNKKLIYRLSIIPLFLFATTLETITDVYFSKQTSYPFQSGEELFDQFILNLVIHAVFLIASFAIRIPMDTKVNKRKHDLLVRDKLEAELNFLKAQLNPHFLFNGINSIYHLIVKSPELAQNTLLIFSSLLRYQLYECNVDLISLEKELNHLNNYISIERIRKGEDVKINTSFDINTENYKIAPLLLMPFVENAFKHISNFTEDGLNYIYVQIKINDGLLILKVENSVSPKPNKIAKIGGVGVKNAKKRLNLVYPNQHDLQLISNEEKFEIILKIKLE